jgi:hypothetical protein
MKWLKFRHKFAHGPGKWQYRPLYKSRLSKADKVELDEEMRELTNEYNYSEKYRGIEWAIIPTKQVPNKHIDAMCEGVKRKMHYHKETAKHIKDVSLPMLKELKGKGRKTCPDELYRKKIERLRKKSLAKRKAKQ